MYPVSEDYIKAVLSPSRKALLKIRFNGTTEIDAAQIKKITITETLAANSSLSMGDACSNMAVLEMFMPHEKIDFDNSTLEAWVAVTTEEGEEYPSEAESSREYCPLGKYYVTDVETDDNYKTVKITAYDAISRMDVDYEPGSNINFPACIEDVAMDIALKNNISLADIDFPQYTINFIACTQREMIGYIAGLMGCNATMDREGKLDFRWYKEKEFLLDSDVQYMNGFKHTATSKFQLGGIVSGTEENPISEGSGEGITFYNPHMTEEVLEEIYDNLSVKEFLPCEVKYRCNPAIECGDIVTVTDKDMEEKKVAVMAQTMEIGGGLNSIIYCYGCSQTQTTMAESPSDRKINKIYNSLKERFKKVTDTIKGANGGHFHILEDEEGFPSGWEIRDTVDAGDSKNLWRMTSGGLAHSKDGGKTFSDVAITMDGQIVANEITAGLLTAIAKETTEQIEIGGRNLILESNIPRYSNVNIINSDTNPQGDSGGSYKPVSPLVAGEEYTISLCVTPAPGTTNIRVTMSNGYKVQCDMSVEGTEQQIVSKIFTASYADGRTPNDSKSNANLYLYRRPNDETVTETTTIHWCKLEKGNKATDWTPAPEDTQGELEEIRTSTIESCTEFINTCDSIVMEALKSYTKTNAFEEYQEKIESQFALLAENLTVSFTKEIEKTNGNVAELQQLNSTYFTFDINGLTIGKADNPNKVFLSNDKITIQVNGVPVQSFNANGRAEIPDLKVEYSIEEFGFITEPDDLGNVNCKYVGK